MEVVTYMKFHVFHHSLKKISFVSAETHFCFLVCGDKKFNIIDCDMKYNINNFEYTKYIPNISNNNSDNENKVKMETHENNNSNVRYSTLI